MRIDMLDYFIMRLLQFNVIIVLVSMSAVLLFCLIYGILTIFEKAKMPILKVEESEKSNEQKAT